jgi:hypothetical protein
LATQCPLKNRSSAIQLSKDQALRKSSVPIIHHRWAMRGFGYAIISAALLTGCMSAAEHRIDNQTGAAQHVQPVGPAGPDADSGGRGGTEEGHDIHSGPM